MTTTNRFRIKAASKKFTDPGPDLLRHRANARKHLSSSMAGELQGWYTKREGGEWSERSTKHDALVKFDAFKGGPDLVLGRKGGDGKISPKFVASHESVTLIPTDRCGRGTILVRSLIEHQFPHIIFAGGYVYKLIEGTTDWSDHAWGDAIDETENPGAGVHNDEVFDWITRMGKAGCMDFDYALGSSKGKIVTSGAPDYSVSPSSAASSHEWHVHISIIDHHGQKPPHEGGHGA